MTTEYHDNEEENQTFWNSEPRHVSFSSVSRTRPWLLPALTATVLLALIIAMGASNSIASNRLWSVEKSISNLTESLTTAQQLAKEAAADVYRLRFAVDNNKDQLTAVGEVLKQLATLDTISKTVAEMKCSLENIINNSSAGSGCCPLKWEGYEGECYFFSTTPLDWHAAHDWCNGQDAHLVILNTEKAWNFVTNLAMGVYYWVGLTDEDGEWKWVNHTPYKMQRSHWRPGQPDSWTHHGLGMGDEDCAHLHSDGRLNDLHCSSSLRFICQRRRQRS